MKKFIALVLMLHTVSYGMKRSCEVLSEKENTYELDKLTHEERIKVNALTELLSSAQDSGFKCIELYAQSPNIKPVYSSCESEKKAYAIVRSLLALVEKNTVAEKAEYMNEFIHLGERNGVYLNKEHAPFIKDKLAVAGIVCPEDTSKKLHDAGTDYYSLDDEANLNENDSVQMILGDYLNL